MFSRGYRDQDAMRVFMHVTHLSPCSACTQVHPHPITPDAHLPTHHAQAATSCSHSGASPRRTRGSVANSFHSLKV